MSINSPQFIEDRLFAEIVNLLPIVTTDIVILNEDKTEILLFKRTNKPAQNLYFTPGGRVWKNEDLLSAIKRQGKTEIGLDLETSKLTFGGVINEIWSDSEFADYNYHAVSIFWQYLISPQEIELLSLDQQHCVFKFFNLQSDLLHQYICERLNILRIK